MSLRPVLFFLPNWTKEASDTSIQALPLPGFPVSSLSWDTGLSNQSTYRKEFGGWITWWAFLSQEKDNWLLIYEAGGRRHL